MNLRQLSPLEEPFSRRASGFPSLFSTVNFRIPTSVIGNIGEDLELDELEEIEEMYAASSSENSRETFNSEEPVAGPSGHSRHDNQSENVRVLAVESQKDAQR